VTAQWYDPTNGTYTTIGTFANSGTHTFASPSSNSTGTNNDFVLVLRAAATEQAALTGLSATPGNGPVIQNRSASSGATSYNIYRSASSGGEDSTPYQTGVSGVQSPVLAFAQQPGEVETEALATGLGLALTNERRLDSNVTSGLPLLASLPPIYRNPLFLEPLAHVRPDDSMSQAADSSESDSALLDMLFASPNMLTYVWFGLDRK
jgi:hypothetical protein